MLVGFLSRGQINNMGIWAHTQGHHVQEGAALHPRGTMQKMQYNGHDIVSTLI